MDAFPEQLPRCVGNSEIRIAFAVEQGVLTGKLDAHRADYFAGGVFHDLKLSQPLFQIIRRKAHGLPCLPQRRDVVHRGAADAEVLRIHGVWRGSNCIFQTLWQFQREINLKCNHEQYDK